MAIDTDFLIDRRRLKRQLTTWRLAAVLLAVAAGFLLGAHLLDWRISSYVARLNIHGVIASDPDRDQALAGIVDNDRVKALIVVIDSPGGTVVGGESLYARFRSVARQKPVVVVMGDVATSAAYMAALGSDRIIAREGTVTGSVGVILQTADVTGLLERIGVKPETIKSTALKAQPNPFEAFTPEAREATRKVVLDIYQSFLDLVRERRQLALGQLAAVADGRIFTGRQALANGLIDEIGGEEEARAWLGAAKRIDPDLPTRDLNIERAEERLSDIVGAIAEKVLTSERVRLDGLVSLWHPAR